MKTSTLLASLGLCVLPLVAQAQWQWIDKDNRKVFSDTAPPPGIPERNILKRPGGQALPPPVPAAAGTAPAVGAAGSPAPRTAASGGRPSGVDKELEERTRRAEEAEKAKQAAEAQRVKEAKASNCERARQGKATFDSGIRVARLNKNGEREIMGDREREEEGRRLDGIISRDCAS